MLQQISDSSSQRWSPAVILSAEAAPLFSPRELSYDELVQPSPLWVSSAWSRSLWLLGVGAALLVLFAAIWAPTMVALDLLLTAVLLARVNRSEVVSSKLREGRQERWLPPRLLIEPALGLRRSLLWLADRMVPAELPLFERSAGIIKTELMRVAAKLRLADLLEEGPLTLEVLAARTRCDQGALTRAVRGLISMGVFSFAGDNTVKNNRLSSGLRADAPGSFRAFAQYFGSASNVNAWAELDRTVATGASAFERVHGMKVWQWFDAHPKERAVFAGAMSSMTYLDAPGIASSRCFDGLTRLCDIAGSQGILLAEVMKQRPALQGVLFECEGLVHEANKFLRAHEAGSRVEVIGGDFFTKVPEGCDGYMMKNVLHDFTDEDALKILEVCRSAMRTGARLFVIELLLTPKRQHEVISFSDLQMMTVCSGGRQRSAEEFGALLSQAGFQLRRVHATATLMHIVEGVAV